jgi:N-acetylmuramoyl-L-alanine amidase
MNYKSLKTVDYIFVHCAATPPDVDIGAKEIDRWHRERGFFQIGYHWVIRRNGMTENGRDPTIPGAHCRGYNERSLAICLVGGCKRNGKVLVPENNFTDDQFVTLAEKLKELHAKFPNAKIVGHNEFDPGKACPSFDVQQWLATVPL